MKLTYVCNEYPPAAHGGIGTFVQTAARGFAAEGHTVSVVGWGAHAAETRDQGVRVVTLPASRLPAAGWFVNRRRIHQWLLNEARSGSTELIETPEYDGPMPFRFHACPVVVRLHLAAMTICRQTGRRVSLAQWWSENQTLRRHQNWIAVSRHSLRLTQETFGLSSQKQAVIYYPVEIPIAADDVGASLPEDFILYAGTVSRRKGAFVLAEAARTILAANPRIHLVYAGPIETERGVPADAHVRQVMGDILSARVHFLGRLGRSQIVACMQRARVFAFPSTLETFGLVIAEAMRAGCPVAVCDAGPIPEFVDHLRTGLLVRPNDPAALAEAIHRLLSDRDLAATVARQARESIATRFSVAGVLRQNLEFYRACLAENRSALVTRSTPALEVQP